MEAISHKRGTPPICHSERKHYAGGLCESCYMKARRRSPRTRMASCHPDRYHYCKGMCSACYNRAYEAKHPEKKRSYYIKRITLPENRLRDRLQKRNSHLRRKFGIDISGKENLLAAQNNRCAICRCSLTVDKACLDHDHSSGKLREILCSACNSGLGHFRDKQELMQKAIKYLQKHGGKK